MGSTPNFDRCSESFVTCLDSLKLKDETDKNEESFPYGEEIGRMYPVLEKIFNYLSYVDLKNVSNMNKDWNEVCKNIIKKRFNLSWLHLSKEENMNIEKSYNFNYDHVDYMFLAYDYTRINLSTYVCVHYKNKTVERKTFMEYIEENIFYPPVNHCLLSISNLYPVFEESDLQSWLCAIGFPKINNIRIVADICDLQVSNKVFHLNNNEKYVCLLVFTTGYPHHTLRKFLNKLLRGYSSKHVALCGGVTCGVKPFNVKKFTNRDFYCIGFIEYCQSNFQAYSVVIPQLENFENHVKKFKENITLYNNAILVRVTCADKEDKNDENIVLHRHFPNIPIVGMDANGEFGWNKFENCTDYCPSPKRKSNFPTLYHGYTSILAMITWKT